MKEVKVEPIYKKVGRRYVPVSGLWYEDARADSMRAGTFRLTYCYADGSRRYDYDVTPATAPLAAAMQVAKVAMTDAIRDASRMSPSGSIVMYTKKQLALIAKFKKDMGGMYPTHWHQKSAHEIAEAALKAVTEFRP